MCKYAFGNYRKILICTDCRIGWKGPKSEFGAGRLPTGTLHCHQCGKPGIDMGHDFHVPRRNRRNQWRKIEKMLEMDFNWQSCGCRGPGPRPRTYADAKTWGNDG